MKTRFVNRNQASLRLPKPGLKIMRFPVDTIFLHHSASKADVNPMKSWSSIQAFHMFTNGWTDIAYSLGGGIDWRGNNPVGVIMEGCTISGKPAVGAHTKNWNSRAVGFCIVGNFENDAVSDLLVQTIRDGVEWMKNEGWVTKDAKLLSHSVVVRTACAGRNLIVKIPEIVSSAEEVNLPKPSLPTNDKYPGFPLRRGHWFGRPSSNPRNHSGYFWAEDRPHIRRFQSQFERRGWRIEVNGRFDERTANIVRAFQKEKGLKQDGLVGEITHRAIWEAPIT